MKKTSSLKSEVTQPETNHNSQEKAKADTIAK